MPVYRSNRKVTPRVLNGKVQKKNRHAPTRRNSLGVGIEKPQQGYRHVLNKEDVWKFIRIIPNWKRVSVDLDLIYLQAGNEYSDGWYEYPEQPSIALCAWRHDLKEDLNLEYYRLHQGVFNRLGVQIKTNDQNITAEFTEETAKAYQLLHIFLHELGHHYYRITHGRFKDGGSENFAESYAIKMEKTVWRNYCRMFNFNPAQQ